MPGGVQYTPVCIVRSYSSTRNHNPADPLRKHGKTESKKCATNKKWRSSNPKIQLTNLSFEDRQVAERDNILPLITVAFRENGGFSGDGALCLTDNLAHAFLSRSSADHIVKDYDPFPLTNGRSFSSK